ncbi:MULTISPECIES: chalcone isomerase family protein [Achromobacter]|uniref:Chalcone isomerase family protein n=1 Tax=Achromobacter spanius TaxID=217203 RepID=A0ABY8H0F0_9BURK|nr:MULTISPECIES: chalcone isomerase family protein [Achromobacter]WAI85939.1 chalcone isomerase family protein [Achromobacter spanius]WEX96020.1 chalcone isomerase family protein [Achromobacter sp. SS2-2022]WFP10261.1 chalcone isomerase family protein [Achromobacter spanius]
MQCISGGRYTALSLILAASLAVAPAFAADREVGGLRVPEHMSEGGRTLVLNGAGLRTRFVVKVYVAALYVTTKSQDATALINSTEPRRIRLQLLRDVDSESLDEALQDGLRDNTPPKELAMLKASADRLKSLVADLGIAREGDVVDVDFDAQGVAVAHNGKHRGRVDNPDFARALLRVWLGDKPAQTSLKNALLGN